MLKFFPFSIFILTLLNSACQKSGDKMPEKLTFSHSIPAYGNG